MATDTYNGLPEAYIRDSGLISKDTYQEYKKAYEQAMRSPQDYLTVMGLDTGIGYILKEEKKETKMSVMRIVQIFVVDTDKNVPLEKRLVYQSDSLFTDSTDQDLLFDINLKAILEEHNKYRATVADRCKSSKEVTLYLEPIKVSQLFTRVIALATF